jgi:hypothetical protein
MGCLLGHGNAEQRLRWGGGHNEVRGLEKATARIPRRQAVPASETYGIARQTFTILTTEANQTLSRLHDRMLVVLDKSSWAEWLDPMTRVDKAQALLLPADEADFHAYRVTPKVGRSDFENPLAHAPLPDLELDLGDAAF